MSVIQITYTFIANTRAKSNEVNQNFSDLVGIMAAHHHDPNIFSNAVPITNSGIAGNAQILDTQLKMNITRSGLINPTSIQNTWPAGSIPVTAFPFNLTTKRADIIEFIDAFTYITKDPAGEIAFTDAVNGTKRISQLGSIKFGGDGSDGALSITSGTTTISIASAEILEKNYTSISITGTGALAFSNPKSTGSHVVLRSQNAVTLTSSAAPMIDCSGLGAAAGTGGIDNTDGTDGTGSSFVLDALSHLGVRGSRSSSGTNSLGQGGAAYGAPGTTMYSTSAGRLVYRNICIAAGSGGGGGGAGQGVGCTGGAGGRGGGGLIIECAGVLNFTTALGISVAGQNGSNGAATAPNETGNGGGGGGAAGMAVVLYNSQTAISGTINNAGGNGGNGTGSGASASGQSGAGGGGAGGIGGAGGAGGGVASNPGTSGSAGGGAGAGGGGGGAGSNSSSSGGTGGAGGSSTGGVLVKNTYF